TTSAKIRSLVQKAKSLVKPSPSIWVISGTECIPIFSSYFRSIKKTRFIYTHSLEYEFFHFSEMRPEIDSSLKNNYILVLDQGWFSKPKPDFLTDKQYPPASRPTFSKEMRLFLIRLTEILGTEVLVSCHPKANLEDTKKLYKGFEVVDSSSAELIRHCGVALANTSTSVGYAVMAKKPLILFTSDELSQSIVNAAEAAISTELQIDYFNMSHLDQLDSVAVTDSAPEHQYKMYQQRYIRQDVASELPLWDAIFSGLASTDTSL
ncbi:MAG: hypothetical protein ACR2QW_04850, partial [bacterium]